MACFRLGHRVKIVIVCIEAFLQQQQAVLIDEISRATDCGEERSGPQFTVDKEWMP